MKQGGYHTHYFVLVHLCPSQYECEVLFICFRVFQNLAQDKLINLTLSFYNNCAFEVGEQQTNLIYYEKAILGGSGYVCNVIDRLFYTFLSIVEW